MEPWYHIVVLHACGTQILNSQGSNDLRSSLTGLFWQLVLAFCQARLIRVNVAGVFAEFGSC